MNLVADIGNSFSKIAVFNGDVLQKSATTGQLDKQFILAFLETINEKVRNVILTSVKPYDKSLDEFFEGCFHHFIHLNHETPLPVKIGYSTPQTLGTDRLAAVVGATVHFPGKNVLAIDAGTCITYDFLNENLIYHGGGISPGIRMRFKALNNFTGQLPLIVWDREKKAVLVGNSTENAMISGVVNGAIAEVEGIITKYEAQCKELQVVITGGDLQVFDKEVKKRIFADPNLVLLGLNKILQYNIES